MARQRRGGGFQPPALRGTLGSLLRTTLAQASAVRDALERGARSGRSRLDEARSGRRRRDALAELGEIVLDLIRRGEIDLGELPEARDLVRFLDDLDADAASDPDDRLTPPPTRRRFDARARDDGYDADRDRFDADRDRHDADRDRHDADRDRHDADRDRHDADRDRFDADRDRFAPDRDRDRFDADRRSAGAGRGRRDDRDARAHHDSDDDGTVSATRGASSRSGPHASRWSPPKPATPPRVWRPTLVDDEPSPEPRGTRDPRDSRDARDLHSSRDARHPQGSRDARDLRDSRTADDARDPRPSRSLAPDPHRKGGIAFEDDDDLADYMHPDDVPPKPPTDGDR